MATIAENLQTIQTIKNNIKTSIENKGVSVGDVSFTEYSTKIDEITTGGTGGEIDFSVLGYDTTLNNSCNNKIQEDIDYSTTILDNWDTSTTNATFKFQNDIKLVYCPLLDTRNVTKMESMFQFCSSLTTIPELNTSNVTNMKNMFNGCTLLQTIPLLDTSSVTTMYNMFQDCKSLTTIPKLDTRNVTDMYCMFYNCSSLSSIPLLNTSNVTTMEKMFYGCDIVHFPHLDTSNVTTFYRIMNSGNTNLVSIPLLDFGSVTNINNFNGSSNKPYVTDLGGFKNLKINWNDNYGLIKFPNLTYESVLNVINNLYDFRGNGDTTTTRTIQFNSKSKALLSDEDIAIATNKGWVIS